MSSVLAQCPDPDQQSPVHYVQVGRPRGFSVSSSSSLADDKDQTNKARPLPSQELTLYHMKCCSNCRASLTPGQEVCTGIVRIEAYGPFPAIERSCGGKKCTEAACYRRTTSGKCGVCTYGLCAVPLLQNSSVVRA